MKAKKTETKNPYILIVEDESLFYRDMADYLTEKGFDVADYTPNYAEAMQHFHEHLPDAILMDIDLNDELNGINVAQRIREFSDVPIIFLSNLPTSDNIFEACRTKADDFLVKSALRNNEQIFTTLQLVLQKKKKVQPKYGIRVLTKYYIELPKNSTTNLSHTLAENETPTRQNITQAEEQIILSFRDIAYITPVVDYKNNTKHSLETNEDKGSQIGKGYQEFQSISGKKFYKHITLTELTELLPDYFLQCSQSFIVNAYKVEKIINHSTITVYKREIKIGTTYVQSFHKKVEQFFIT